jgi:hypothetical protein
MRLMKIGTAKETIGVPAQIGIMTRELIDRRDLDSTAVPKSNVRITAFVLAPRLYIDSG